MVNKRFIRILKRAIKHKFDQKYNTKSQNKETSDPQIFKI